MPLLRQSCESLEAMSVNSSKPKLVGKPPSREALKMAYEYIIANILPRMTEGKKEKPKPGQKNE
jgi:hypothetical protein